MLTNTYLRAGLECRQLINNAELGLAIPHSVMYSFLLLNEDFLSSSTSPVLQLSASLKPIKGNLVEFL